MSGNEERPVTAGREGLAAQLRELEAFVAKSNADGEPVPTAAVEMVERLHALLQALDELSASLGEP